ncbi:hypothetical protein [Bradyrhizobium sp. S3.2.12]|uniref:hypothetical protein n=1 Tax=Bradyrhizobium sp. S3.2.12 TaxID=3156387 RepID=UPI003392D149
MNERLLGSYNCAADNLGEPVSGRNVPSRENEFAKGPDSTAKEYFFGRRWGDLAIIRRFSTLPHMPARRKA